MANTILIKRKTTAGAPTTGQLAVGEMCLVIPDNAILVEAIGFYCMYKMLCRGYKHPVFNLSASQYGTNPYYTWLQLKEEAKRSVINRGQDIDGAHKQWRNAFFNFTFNPKG